MKPRLPTRLLCLLILGVGMIDLYVQAVKPAPPQPHNLRLNLYPDTPPGEPVHEGALPAMDVNESGRYKYVHEPVIDVFHAKGDNPTGAAVIVCPGGGYGILAYDHEGIQVAQWLSENGITGIVLRYRMMPYRHPVPMMDVQRAMQTVRANAQAWSIDPDRIGVLGFSAGGHLASTAAVHHIEADPDSDDPILRVSSRPDFAVLIYPVITMRQPHAHMGSRQKLLGPAPSDELLDLMSTHKQVSKATPPTLLVHSKDDKAVPIENSEIYLAALNEHGVTSKLLTYEQGGHGYGMGQKGIDASAWPAACIEWFNEIGITRPAKGE